MPDFFQSPAPWASLENKGGSKEQKKRSDGQRSTEKKKKKSWKVSFRFPPLTVDRAMAFSICYYKRRDFEIIARGCTWLHVATRGHT